MWHKKNPFSQPPYIFVGGAKILALNNLSTFYYHFYFERQILFITFPITSMLPNLPQEKQILLLLVLPNYPIYPFALCLVCYTIFSPTSLPLLHSLSPLCGFSGVKLEGKRKHDGVKQEERKQI